MPRPRAEPQRVVRSERQRRGANAVYHPLRFTNARTTLKPA
jgi:hypothetical protein